MGIDSLIDILQIEPVGDQELDVDPFMIQQFIFGQSISC
jgi:hypothetical protein